MSLNWLIIFFRSMCVICGWFYKNKMFYCLFLFMNVKVNRLWPFNHIKLISLLVFYFILYDVHVGNTFALTLACLCQATKKFLEH